MYFNKRISEPQWKSWIIETKNPLFNHKQCQDIIECGYRQPAKKGQIGISKSLTGVDTEKRVSTISWIPFKEMPFLYNELDTFIQKANLNHFGFDDIRITEEAQFTEYSEGNFYDWHMDCDVYMKHEPPVRKISMTILLNDPKEFEGGRLELISKGNSKDMQQGEAICFASFINHRVTPITKGIRKSLVVWFGGVV